MVYTARHVVTLASLLVFLHPDIAVNLFLSVGSLGLQSPSAPISPRFRGVHWLRRLESVRLENYWKKRQPLRFLRWVAPTDISAAECFRPAAT